MNKKVQETGKEQRILMAAEQVFSHKGYIKATLDEIIKIADTGKGTVYKYYKNKDYLFYTLVQLKHKEFMEELSRCCDGKLSFEERFKSFLIHLMHFIFRNKVLWQVLIFETMASTTGWHLVKGEGPNDYQVEVQWGDAPTAEEVEEKKKYFLLIGEEIAALESILLKGIADNEIKPMSELHLVSTNIFFGNIVMLSQRKEQNMSVEETAANMCDMFMNGHKK